MCSLSDLYELQFTFFLNWSLPLLKKQASIYSQLVEMSDQNFYFRGMLYLPIPIKHFLCLVNMVKNFLH